MRNVNAVISALQGASGDNVHPLEFGTHEKRNSLTEHPQIY